MIRVVYIPDKKSAHVYIGESGGTLLSDIERFRTYENEDGTFAFDVVGWEHGARVRVRGRADVLQTIGEVEE